MPDSTDVRIKPNKPSIEGAVKNPFSGSPDPNKPSEGRSMAVRYRRLRGRGRTNFLRDPMLLLYSLVAGGLLVAVVIRIALVS